MWDVPASSPAWTPAALSPSHPFAALTLDSRASGHARAAAALAPRHSFAAPM
jgi:hypothetical protein